MKYFKYTAILFMLVIGVTSCTKHELLYDTTEVDSTMTEFQLHYFAPVVNDAANYIDSVFVNGILYSSVRGSGQLQPYNGVPGGTVGRFFAIKSGNTNFQFYRKDVIVYDYNVELKSGKQNVFVYDFTKAPIVIDNGYPYRDKYNTGATVAGWDTDSIATVRFYNFLYEDATNPYKGKIQYQYQDYRTKEWMNFGEPVGFGEATERIEIVVVKETFNSQGTRRVDYRMLDENGDILRIRNSAGGMVDYSDWWNSTIGRATMHIFAGIRTLEPRASVRTWTNL